MEQPVRRSESQESMSSRVRSRNTMSSVTVNIQSVVPSVSKDSLVSDAASDDVLLGSTTGPAARGSPFRQQADVSYANSGRGTTPPQGLEAAPSAKGPPRVASFALGGLHAWALVRATDG